MKYRINVHICGQKKLNRRSTHLSNIHSRTTCRIYRLALPLLSRDKLSSLSKLRIFLFNAHLALFVQSMTQLQSLNSVGKYRHLVN